MEIIVENGAGDGARTRDLRRDRPAKHGTAQRSFGNSLLQCPRRAPIFPSARTPSRRGLISGLAALIAAPALVRASSIMPAKAWVEPAVTADPMPISDDMADFFRGLWEIIDRCLLGHQSPLPCEGRLPEVSAWKSTAGPGGLSAPDGALFPARSPAVVQSHQRALPMSSSPEGDR